MVDVMLPTFEQRKKILAKIDYTEDRLKEDLKKLREWLEKQPHLPKDASDNFLTSFLVAMKSVERAKERLDGYYAAKAQYTVAFEDMDPTHLPDDDAIQQFVVPGWTKEGCRVFYLRLPPESDVDNFNHLAVIRRQLMMLLLGCEKDPVSGGFMVVYDLKGASPSFLAKWNLKLHNMAVTCFQDVMPLRIKKVVIMNCLPFIVKIFETVVKPLLKKKIADRITMIANGEAKLISKHIPIEFLPEDLGGTAPPCKSLTEDWVKILKSEREFYIREQEIKSNEALRPGKPKFTSADVFGVDGNFRSLSID